MDDKDEGIASKHIVDFKLTWDWMEELLMLSCLSFYSITVLADGLC